MDKAENAMVTITKERYDYFIWEIERLREQVEFERTYLQAAFGELTKLDKDIEDLKKTIETLEEEVYLRTSDLTHVIVGMNYKE